MEFKQNATAERKKYQLCRDRFHNFNVDLNLHLNQGWLNFHIYIYIYTQFIFIHNLPNFNKYHRCIF